MYEEKINVTHWDCVNKLHVEAQYAGIRGYLVSIVFITVSTESQYAGVSGYLVSIVFITVSTEAQYAGIRGYLVGIVCITVSKPYYELSILVNDFNGVRLFHVDIGLKAFSALASDNVL